MRFDIPPGAEHILQTLTDAGFEAYLVGGCVRDLLRGAPAHDWDVCTSAHPEETKTCFAGHRIIETGLKHGTVTVMEGSGPYEITTYRTEGPYSDSRRPDYVRFVSHLEEDLARRDFTINAIALGLDGNLRDPFGGADDISSGLIRCVGEPDRRFQEDGLRVMRALRFSAVFGYEIQERTAQAIHENKAVLNRVAAERINAELCGLLTGPNAGNVLRQYPDVLCQLWPELGPAAALDRRCRDGWERTVCALEAAPADTAVRLTILLHDTGLERADQMLRAMKFDSAVRKRTAVLAAHYNAELTAESPSIRRWLSRLGPEVFFQLLEVTRADCMSRTRDQEPRRLAELEAIKAGAEQILAQRQCLTRQDLAVNGKDVIGAGIAPGPEVGRVLDELLEQILKDEIPNERSVLLELIAHRQG